MVKYWKRGDCAKARKVEAPDGSYRMEIEGEKRMYPGYPRGHVLSGTLAKFKNKLKNQVFNHVFRELDKVVSESGSDMLPVEHMMPAVRHMYETFEKLEDCEIVPDMKDRIRLVKRVMCWFFQEDDAYRFRAQLFLDLIDQKKVRLSKDDLYFARGKYWKPDRYKKLFGKVWDGYEY